MTTMKTRKPTESNPPLEPKIVATRRRRKVKVRPYHDPTRPNLKFVVNHREAGNRRRSYFPTKEEAQSFASFKNAELKTKGIEAAEFPTAWRIQAQEAIEALQPFGKSIRDAVQHYVAHLRASERSCSAEELVKQLLKAKTADGAGERHLSDLESRLSYFSAKFDGQVITTITTKDVDAYLRELPVAPVTRNHHRNVLVQAFNFAITNGYTTENPAAKAAKAKVVGGRPGILTVEQASALACNSTAEILPFFAIGLFAGLRRAELARLDWAEVDFESGLIQVTAEKSKTATRRFVTMQPNLHQWLLPLRQLKGPIVAPENFRQLFNHTRVLAGITEWPENAMRHSFASYHLAAFKNAAATALELGHHDSRVTFAHYRELVKPREAARYWKLKPIKSSKIVHMGAS
jgi:integrase